MATIELCVRNLETSEAGVVTFEDEEKAIAWLRTRPNLVDVLGPAHPLGEELEARMRGVLRPLDAVELAFAKQGAEARRESLRAMAEAETRRLAERAAAAPPEDLSPDRPMRIRWTFDVGMQLAEAGDTRPIPPAAQAAILAWIAERNDWVSGRGQMVGDARCTVSGGEVLDGTFVPVSAAAAGAKS